MKTLVPKNFCVEYNTRLSGFVDGAKKCFVSIDGKIKTGKNKCPFCGSCERVDNGYYCIEDSVITSLGLRIKIAQFRCKKCSAFWSSERDFIDDIIQKEKSFVKCLLIGAVRQGLSFESATSLVEETVGHSYSPQYLHELYTTALDNVKQEKFYGASGVYNYDEQHLKENGNAVYRLAIKDAVDGKIILEKLTSNVKKETIAKEVSKAFLYVIPNEKSNYLENLELIKKKTNLEINIFAVNDKNKYDPENKAQKSKPNKPAIYLE